MLNALVLVLLTFGLPSTVYAQDAVDQAFARVYAEYRSLQGRPDVGRLVELDREFRRILPKYVSATFVAPNGRSFIEATYLRPGYEDLGISRALFEPDLLVYSGKLLRDAHALDPGSPHRSSTLFAELFPNGEQWGELPDLQAARAYLREFPQGPFAADVYLELAHLRDDLFKLLRDMIDGVEVDYKRDCYGAFLTKEPLQQQLRAAQASALANYERVLALRPGDEAATESLEELRTGKSITWYFCPD